MNTESASMSQEPNVKNWRDFDTSTLQGRYELNTYIAQRVGYTVILSEPHNRVCAQRFAPNGAWERSYFTPEYVDPERVAWQNGPDYVTDLNTTWELVPDMQSGFYFYLSNTGTPARCRVQHNGENIVDELADTPALAVCYAWLALQDANGGQSS